MGGYSSIWQAACCRPAALDAFHFGFRDLSQTVVAGSPPRNLDLVAAS